MKPSEERWENDLGLPPLFNGVPNFELRITVDENRLEGWKIVIRQMRGKWTADLFTFYYTSSVEGGVEPDSLVGKVVYNGNPNSGWKFLLNSLVRHKTFTLPDCSSLANYSIDTDELGVTIAIANKNNFKHYSYLGPQRRIKTHSEAYEVVQIVELLKKEFPINKHVKNLKSPYKFNGA